MRIFLSSVSCAILIFGCGAISTTSAPSEEISLLYNYTTIRWTTGQEVRFATRVRAAEEGTQVCGAYASSPGGDSNQDKFDEWMINTARVESATTILVNGLGFFGEVPYRASGELSGMANCIVTSTPWQRAFYRSKSRVVTTRSSFSIRD